MSGFLFSSHDGFGLGHLRRNTKVAAAVRALDPRAPIALVTGVASHFGWLDRDDAQVIRVPPIVKGSDGQYEAAGMPLDEALALRARTFDETVRRLDPDVVVVDRHPFGIIDELREGLEHARRRGSRIVLGLRDILDDPATVAEELAGARWAGAADVYDEVIVYGERHLCDQEKEYALPIRPRYCGWVADAVPPTRREARLLAITAGGGGDGEAVCRLGLEVLRYQPRWTAIFAAGPFGGDQPLARSGTQPTNGRLAVATNVDGCTRLFARASGVLQMAGYNSTYEALAAGLRPIFVPRRAPRQEQAIRANRLAAFGLADVVPEGATAGDVAGLLDRPRTLPADALLCAGIALDGAPRAASHLIDLARHREHARSRAGLASTQSPSLAADLGEIGPGHRRRALTDAR
jgi:predicted glycosyltransferase